MDRIIPLAALVVFGASGIAKAEDVYIATFTGTFTTVDFDGVDPGRFANLNPGDTYSLTITTTTTPRYGGGLSIYDALSLVLTINDGIAPFEVLPGPPKFIVIDAVPADYYVLSLAYGVLDGPFNGSARLALVDFDGDPTRLTEDLPLSLDLNAFGRQREFGLFGGESYGPFPEARATVDTFSAQIIPAPAAVLPVSFVCAFTRRRASR